MSTFNLEILAANRRHYPTLPYKFLGVDYTGNSTTNLASCEPSWPTNNIRRPRGWSISDGLRLPEALFNEVPALRQQLLFHIFDHPRMTTGVDLGVVLG